MPAFDFNAVIAIGTTTNWSVTHTIMLQTRLLASRAARSLRRPPQCRFDSSHSATPDAGHGASTPAHASHPPTESFSVQFPHSLIFIKSLLSARDFVALTSANNPFL